MFQKPTVADLRQAAQKLGMNPSDDYLDAVEQIITPLANAYADARRDAGRAAGGEISARSHSIGRRRRRTRTAPGT